MRERSKHIARKLLLKRSRTLSIVASKISIHQSAQLEAVHGAVIDIVWLTFWFSHNSTDLKHCWLVCLFLIRSTRDLCKWHREMETFRMWFKNWLGSNWKHQSDAVKVICWHCKLQENWAWFALKSERLTQRFASATKRPTKKSDTKTSELIAYLIE